ncbi:MAG: HDOD domain-containing protein [Planctomycetales bacterium]|nr:HDOD domain-containing protein [Planctomycetales bacterium]
MTSADSHTAIDLDKILAGAQLPALPQSAIRLLELSKDPNNGPAEFAAPIETDPGLTGQVLRFVNSSYFGFSREISSIKLAITLVGIRTIKNFALWSAVFSLMPNPKCGPFDLKNLWQDSLRRGIFARVLGKLLGLKDAEGPFAAALLQDLAVPLLAKELGDRYAEIIENRDGGKKRISEMEREAFGWTHAEAGALIARKWNLPEEFATLIEYHTELESLLSDPAAEPGKLAVAASSLLPVSGDEAWADQETFLKAIAKLVGNNGPSVEELLAQVDEQFAEFGPILDISEPGKSLVAWYQEAAAVA